MIKTAEVGKGMKFLGNVKVGGLVGIMNVSKTASCNVLSVGKLQDKNVRVTFMVKVEDPIFKTSEYTSVRILMSDEHGHV